MLLAEGALEKISDTSPALNVALLELFGNRYNQLCIKLAEGFKEDYLRSIQYHAENPNS